MKDIFDYLSIGFLFYLTIVIAINVFSETKDDVFLDDFDAEKKIFLINESSIKDGLNDTKK